MPLAVGCDLGGTELKTVALRGRRLVWRSSAPAADIELGALLDLLEGDLARALGSARRGRERDPSRFCLALPGFLDAERRRLLHAVHLRRLEGLPLARRLEQRLRRRGVRRVLLEPDSNAGAIGEARLGAGRGAARVLYLTLGTGVGAAMAIDGEPVRVSRHTLGQVAHLPILGGARRCACGQRGCAEAELSAAGLVAAARGAGLSAVRGTSAKEVFERWRRGEAAARSAFRDYGERCGRLAAVLANLFSPDRIVIGGGLAGAAEAFLPAARAALARHGHPSRVRGIELLPSRLGPFAGAAGAALIARDA